MAILKSEATQLYDVQREPFWIHARALRSIDSSEIKPCWLVRLGGGSREVAWTAGTPNDCVHVAWKIMAVAGMESHMFTTDGQRDNSFFNMLGAQMRMGRASFGSGPGSRTASTMPSDPESRGRDLATHLGHIARVFEVSVEEVPRAQ